MTSGVLRRVALAGAVLAGAACASRTPIAGAPEEAAREPRRVTVIVKNDGQRAAAVTVWVQARRGGRQMLGTVLANATESFRFTPDLPAGDYVLIGRTDSGTEIVSNPFPISRTAVVSWSLFSNIATTSQLAPDEP